VGKKRGCWLPGELVVYVERGGEGGVDGDAWVGKKEGVMCKVRAGCRFGVVWDVGRSAV
jgi:hypothetical protein